MLRSRRLLPSAASLPRAGKTEYTAAARHTKGPQIFPQLGEITGANKQSNNFPILSQQCTVRPISKCVHSPNYEWDSVQFSGNETTVIWSSTDGDIWSI